MVARASGADKSLVAGGSGLAGLVLCFLNDPVVASWNVDIVFLSKFLRLLVFGVNFPDSTWITVDFGFVVELNNELHQLVLTGLPILS